jgi:hypothetical protein
MKRRIVSLSLAAVIMIVSCGVPQSDYDKLKSENDTLKAQLDDCQNGAGKLIAAVEKAYNERDYSQARHNIELLQSKHPESPKNPEFQILLRRIDELESEQKRQKEAEEMEQRRLQNIDSTGIWGIGHYVDDFGERTGERYIGIREKISGSFSNTATQNSALNVKFLISSSTDISIKLYEYAGNNPLKAVSPEYYWVGIKDCEGNKYTLDAENRSDRLEFSKTNSQKLHNILMKGGQVQFWIKESANLTTQYQFTVDNADLYDNAYRKLTEKWSLTQLPACRQTNSYTGVESLHSQLQAFLILTPRKPSIL